MDNKSWIWRKRSSEKTIVITDKFGISVKGIDDQEIQKLPMAKEVGSLKSVRSLNERLASVLLDSHQKDEKQENLAQKDIAGQEKKEEIIRLKEERDEGIKQDIVADAKLIHPDAGVKHWKESSEFEKAQKRLEEKLMETSKRLADLAVENDNLNKVLVVKERLLEELHTHSSQTRAELKTLIARLDSIEKENAFLKYEFYMLEKELEVRNEELEYTRRSADASHRQQLESVRKMTMLESECQRLRVLIRKKLPGPAAFIPGRDPIEQRRKPNPVRDLVLRDTTSDRSPEVSVKNIDFLIEQLRSMEEENRTLKGILSKKNAELKSSRFMYSKTASILSQAEARKSMNLAKRSLVPTELYPITGFDTCSDDGGSSSGSWANALMSELEQFKDAKVKSLPGCKAIEVSDISLMDDFAEMERLAIVSSQEISGMVNDIAGEKSFDWLQQVLNAILREQRVTKRNLTELLEDIKIALGYINHPYDISGEVDAFCVSREQSSGFQINVSSQNDKIPVQTTSKQSNLEEESKRLLDELNNMESERKDTGLRLDEIENLMMQLQESKQSIEILKLELETTKASKGMIEDDIENQKLINEELDTQLTVSKAKLNEVLQKFTSLEAELEEKSSCCEELEVTCLELQLQLESVARKDSFSYSNIDERAQTRNGSEITAASLKLAECQETILNLGKQLKALATPREVALLDKVFNASNPTTTAAISKNLKRRFSLHDRMAAEDSAKAIIVRCPEKDAETVSSNGNSSAYTAEAKADSNLTPRNASAVSLAIVPSKKQNVGLLKRLLMRKRNRSSKKSQSLGKDPLKGGVGVLYDDL
ncbi:hypothetical protein M5689_000133 [Euphorbia peplus]|nr:hypothetical protein M5689_000133 [Euphorbia peplus]